MIQAQLNTGQCLVLDPGPILMSHQSSGDACHMDITFTCTGNGVALIWSSPIFLNDFLVIAGKSFGAPVVSETVTGVTVSETNNNNPRLLNSTITFKGNLTSLTALKPSSQYTQGRVTRNRKSIQNDLDTCRDATQCSNRLRVYLSVATCV